jgi:hypothetical protein
MGVRQTSLLQTFKLKQRIPFKTTVIFRLFHKYAISRHFSLVGIRLGAVFIIHFLLKDCTIRGEIIKNYIVEYEKDSRVKLVIVIVATKEQGSTPRGAKRARSFSG